MNKIQFSYKFKDFCNKNNLSIDMVYLVQCSLMSEREETINVLLESLESENYDILMRVVLCDFDGSWTLKQEIPLFYDIPNEVVEKKEEKSLFKEFMDKLLKSGLTGKGHPDNLKQYTVISKAKEVKEEFENLYNRKKIDLSKLVLVISNYYETTEYAKKLDKVLSEIDFEYDSFKDKKDSFWD